MYRDVQKLFSKSFSVIQQKNFSYRRNFFFKHRMNLTFFYILYKKKVLESWKFSISGFYRIFTFWDALNTISLFLQNVCLCVSNFVAVLRQKIMGGIAQNFLFSCILLAYLRKFMLITFWFIEFNNIRRCSEFLISWTQCYRTKLHAVVPNTNYFESIILKFKTFIVIAIVR